MHYVGRLILLMTGKIQSWNWTQPRKRCCSRSQIWDKSNDLRISGRAREIM